MQVGELCVTTNMCGVTHHVHRLCAHAGRAPHVRLVHYSWLRDCAAQWALLDDGARGGVEDGLRLARVRRSGGAHRGWFSCGRRIDMGESNCTRFLDMMMCIWSEVRGRPGHQHSPTGVAVVVAPATIRGDHIPQRTPCPWRVATSLPHCSPRRALPAAPSWPSPARRRATEQ